MGSTAACTPLIFFLLVVFINKAAAQAPIMQEVCEDCSFSATTTFDAAKYENDIRTATKKFMEDYASALDDIDCSAQLAQDAATNCQVEADGQRAYLVEYNNSVTNQLDEISKLVCAQASFQPNDVCLNVALSPDFGQRKLDQGLSDRSLQQEICQAGTRVQVGGMHEFNEEILSLEVTSYHLQIISSW